MVMPTRPLSSSEVLLKECSDLEEELVGLKVAWEQYFMGLERFAPSKAHDSLKKRLNNLRTRLKGSTAAKFRAQQLVGKFHTYERLWERTVKEIENGTYRRDLLRLRRKTGGAQAPKKEAASESVDIPADFDGDDLDSALDAAVQAVTKRAAPATSGVAPAIPAVVPLTPTVVPIAGSAPAGVPLTVRAARPSAPGPQAPAAPAPASVPTRPVNAQARPTGTLEEAKLRAVYNAYVTAKKQCREDVSAINFDSVASSLRRQVPELMKKHGANSVDFKVVIKDGKAVLRAVPK